MQTALPDSFRATALGAEADAILRSCVHCGFCNATCPTYQLLGDELDGPRGRIYQIKGMLEGAAVTRRTLTHLDRCLTCRNCESTCPSGVRYGRLLDIGRATIEQRVARPWPQRVARWMLRRIVPYPARFTPLLRIGQLLRPLLFGALREKVPAYRRGGAWPAVRHPRHVLLLEGCAQPAIAPGINAAAAQVLDRLGLSAIRVAGEVCCGAASHHTSGEHEALEFARRNVDALWPHIEAGAEAIVSSASGCGVFVKDYGHLLRDDPVYAGKAQRVAELTRDLSEVIGREDLAALRAGIVPGRRVAFQSPCSLQHGQKLNGRVEQILRELGFTLTAVPEGNLCCGSAGTYSLLQPALAQQLRRRKLDALASGAPEVIVTANIGCLAHLQGGAPVAMRHWVELLQP